MAPRISIGLPVYNGEKYLQQAVESILTQTLGDFELIISDNASTDRTGEICESFAARDRRVRYHRNPANVGAGKNYNRVFELARAPYFKWAAHDDVCAPRFLEMCIAALDRDPAIVLAYPRMVDIDENGKNLGVRNISHIPRAERGTSPHPYQRFRKLIRTDYTVEEIFGVIRTDVLRRSRLIQSYTDSDRTLLAELGLMGPFTEVPELLFYHRMHSGMSTKVYNGWQERTAWFDPAKVGRATFPLWRQMFEYLWSIIRVPLPLSERAWCFLYMGNWIRESAAGLAKELFKGIKVKLTS